MKLLKLLIPFLGLVAAGNGTTNGTTTGASTVVSGTTTAGASTNATTAGASTNATTAGASTVVTTTKATNGTNTTAVAEPIFTVVATFPMVFTLPGNVSATTLGAAAGTFKSGGTCAATDKDCAIVKGIYDGLMASLKPPTGSTLKLAITATARRRLSNRRLGEAKLDVKATIVFPKGTKASDVLAVTDTAEGAGFEAAMKSSTATALTAAGATLTGVEKPVISVEKVVSGVKESGFNLAKLKTEAAAETSTPAASGAATVGMSLLAVVFAALF